MQSAKNIKKTYLKKVHILYIYSDGEIVLLFFTFSILLVANPEKLLYTVVNPACGLLNRERKVDRKRASTCLGATQVSVRLALVQNSSARLLMGVASQNSTLLPCAIATFPASLPLSSPNSRLCGLRIDYFYLIEDG